jgi:hypothetical protein
MSDILIKRLISSEQYRALQGLKPQFNLFTVLNDAMHENAWSRMFAGLLDSTLPHELGVAMLREWLSEVANENPSNPGKVSPLLLLISPNGSIKVSVEHSTPEGRRIDILIQILDPQRQTVGVIGVENKLDSPEQPTQVSDYQTALSGSFSGIPRLLIFLTPDRRAPKTAADSLDCPCLPTSYRTMVDACRKLSAGGSPEVKLLLECLSREIEETVLGESRMTAKASALVLELWSDPEHRKALRLISELLPTPRRVWEEKLLDQVRDRLSQAGSKMEPDILTFYPQGASPREIKVWCGSEFGDRTEELGFHVCYMLHSDDRIPDIGSTFIVRLMAWCDSSKGREFVKSLALERAFPKSGERKSWAKLEGLWTGGSYSLQDLGTRDLVGLSTLLVDSVKETYPIIAKRILDRTTAPPNQALQRTRARRNIQ